MNTTETSLVGACIQWLLLHGCYVWRNNTGTAMVTRKDGNRYPVRFGHTGSADIVGVMPGGRFIGVECKRPLGPRGGSSGRMQTPEQTQFEREIKRMGGVYILARSIDDLEAAYTSV